MNAAMDRSSEAVDRSAATRGASRAADVLLLSIAVVAAYFSKRWYAAASAEDLGWVLKPTVSIVERVTGERFVFEAHVGFVSARHAIVVEPACAGLNFLIVALLTLSFGFVPRMGSVRAKSIWFAATPLFGYVAALVANAARITAAVWAHAVGYRVPLLSPSEAHRALGVAVYLTSTWLVFAMGERAGRRIGHAL